MNFMKELISQAKIVFGGMSKSQKMSIMLLAVTVISLLVFMTSYRTGGDFQPILKVADLSDSEKDKVVSKLEQEGYEVVVEAGEIKVPREYVNEIMRSIAADRSLPLDMSFTFSQLIETSSPFLTKEINDSRYRLALQNTLSKVITSFDSVKKATVIIQTGDNHIFIKGNEPSASITVKTAKVQKLNEETALSIAKLVASSVKGLKMKNISLVDLDGNFYNTNAALDAGINASSMSRARLEHASRIKESVMKVLSYMKQVDVQVSLDIETDPQHVEAETFSSEPITLEDESKKIESTTWGLYGSPVSEKDKHQMNNTDKTVTLKLEDRKTSQNDTTTKIVKRAVPKTRTVTEKRPGTFKGINGVIIAIPKEYPVNEKSDPENPNSEVVVKMHKNTIQDIEVLKKDIAIQLGLLTPEEQQKVAVHTRPWQIPIAIKEQSMMEKIMDGVSNIGASTIMLMTLAFITIMIARNTIVKMLPSDKKESGAGGGDSERKISKEEALEPLSEPTLDPKTRQVQERVREIVKEQPDKSASIIKMWLTRE